jgi:hypothetical protein
MRWSAAEWHNGSAVYVRNNGETVAGRLENLKPWPRGVSGNPAGRPKGDISSEIARAIFENNAEAIYRGMARRLAKGDPRLFKVLAERACGRVKEQVEVDFSQSILERLQEGRRRVLEGMSEAELSDRIEQLQRQLGMLRKANPLRGTLTTESMSATAGFSK